ncbi:MAG: Gfo/Idh/MocA family oxidoreductase [Bryobacterales bacterium]|nr:Gfo/Idh/MocA family oxidoreductase [Bryobacterales bacterium]
MSSITRRNLLASALPLAAALGANDRVNVAVVGLGGRGTDHVKTYSGLPNTRVAAVCDVNQAARERAVALVRKLQGHTPAEFNDMRQLFASKDIDAVSIATPNHWHALAMIWACQAGKDVYVEKPACYNVFEGRKMIEAARKYNRMVQVGSQSRSIQHKIRAMQLLREGVIGKVYMAKGLCFKRRKSIGHTPETPVPPGIDWDLFLGPAPKRPFTMNRFKYNWHWFWDTGNGDIGNQGVHEMDIARWGMNMAGLPKSVVATGGKYLYVDDQETPNTELASFDYGDNSELQFEVRGLHTNGEGSIVRDSGGNVIGDLFFGSDGWMSIDFMGFQVYKGEKNEKVMDEPHVEAQTWPTAPHMENFLDAVRHRDHTRLHADIEIGVISACLCHLANISYRVGRELKWNAGRWEFVNAPDANRLLTRDYRAPYIVPNKV